MEKLYLTLILIFFGTALAFTNHFLFMAFLFICFCLMLNILVNCISAIILNEKEDIDK
jgi:ABC-type Na+ efflux pump permease subunit